MSWLLGLKKDTPLDMMHGFFDAMVYDAHNAKSEYMILLSYRLGADPTGFMVVYGSALVTDQIDFRLKYAALDVTSLPVCRRKFSSQWDVFRKAYFCYLCPLGGSEVNEERCGLLLQ